MKNCQNWSIGVFISLKSANSLCSRITLQMSADRWWSSDLRLRPLRTAGLECVANTGTNVLRIYRQSNTLAKERQSGVATAKDRSLYVNVSRFTDRENVVYNTQRIRAEEYPCKPDAQKWKACTSSKRSRRHNLVFVNRGVVVWFACSKRAVFGPRFNPFLGALLWKHAATMLGPRHAESSTEIMDPSG